MLRSSEGRPGAVGSRETGWYVAAALRGTGPHLRNARLRALATGVAAVAVAASLGACGGDEKSADANEKAGTYDLEVTEASFPREQDLGQTSLLRIGVRNSGEGTVPALTVTAAIAGRDGSSSQLPFGVRERQAGLAQPDRPVWVLSPGYPKLNGSNKPGGASTSNAKTFALGPLKPGETTKAVWRLSAVRAGDYTVRYLVGAGLSPEVKARTEGGGAPGGSFAVTITSTPPNTEVTDNGEVVPAQRNARRTAAEAGGGKARVVPRAEGE